MAQRPPEAGSASTRRSLQVLEALVESGEPISLTDLAARCGMAVTTCWAITAALESQGYAQRTVVGRSHLWRPTLKLYSMGMATLHRVELGDESAPVLNHLRDNVGLPAHLGVLDGAQVVYVSKAATTRMVQFNTFPGRMSPYNHTALGKAIAAFSPEARAAELIELATPGTGPKAKRLSRKELREEFAIIRERGYAIEDQEEEPGIACIAAPVVGDDGYAVAAIGVTGLEHQILGESRATITESVVGAADTLARRTRLRGNRAGL